MQKRLWGKLLVALLTVALLGVFVLPVQYAHAADVDELTVSEDRETDPPVEPLENPQFLRAAASAESFLALEETITPFAITIPPGAVSLGFTLTSINSHTTITEAYWHSPTMTNVGNLYLVVTYSTGKNILSSTFNSTTVNNTPSFNNVNFHWQRTIGGSPSKDEAVVVFYGVTFDTQNTITIQLDAGGHTVDPGGSAPNLIFYNYRIEYYEVSGATESLIRTEYGPPLMNNAPVLYGDIAARHIGIGGIEWYLKYKTAAHDFIKILYDDNDGDEIVLNPTVALGSDLLFNIDELLVEGHVIKVYYEKKVTDKYFVTYVLDNDEVFYEDLTPYDEDDEVTIIADEPTKNGFTFAGWKSDIVDDDEIYFDGDKFDMPDDHVILTAQWDPKGGYIVNYDLNYTMAPTIASMDNVKWTDTGLLPSPAPTRLGFTLAGWVLLDDNGDKTSVWVTGADSYGKLAVDDDVDEIWLQAQWTPLSYTVVYAPGAAGTWSAASYTTTGLGYNASRLSNTIMPDTATMKLANYTFLGWSPALADYVTGNVTYTAQWNYITPPPPPTPPPGGGGGVGTGGGGLTPATTNPAPAVVPPADPPLAPEPTVIEPEPAPLAAADPVSITPEPAPLSSFAAWALLNLILTFVTGVIMAMLLVTYFAKRKDEDENDPYADNEEKVKRYLLPRLITIAATVIAVILFVMTQDITLPMIIADNWTIWHVVITAVTVVMAILSKKTYGEEEQVKTYV